MRSEVMPTVMVNRVALGRVVRAFESILEGITAENLKHDPAYAYLIDALADCKLALR